MIQLNSLINQPSSQAPPKHNTGGQPVTSSLVPRPFPPQVFDRILYAKTEGEGLGERVTCVMSGRREDRHRGGGA